jgi:phytanoyl-CoA hydroxylase
MSMAHETPAQAFVADGYYIARSLFDQDEMQAVLDAFMKFNENGPVEGLSETIGGLGKYSADDPLSFYPRIMMPHWRPDLEVGEIAKRYLVEPRLHGYLKSFLGEEPIGVQTMFYFKPPGARGQELHQDNFYLMVRPGTCMAAWIALEDADFENGGMKVVPGSQEMEIVCPEKADASKSFTTDFVPVPEGLKEVQLEMKAGDVLFFNGSVIHGSPPNSSKTRFRRSLICHYIPLGSEVGRSYIKDPVLFSGEVVEVKESFESGPCGVAQPLPIH